MSGVIFEIKNSEFIEEMWKNYSIHYKYSNGIKFQQVTNAIEYIKELILGNIE